MRAGKKWRTACRYNMGNLPCLPDELIVESISTYSAAELRVLCLTHPRFVSLVHTYNVRFVVVTPLCIMSARHVDGAACYQLMLACGTSTIGRNVYQIVRILLNLRTAGGTRMVAVHMLF